MKTYTYITSMHMLAADITEDQIDSIPKQGQCSKEIAALAKELEPVWDEDKLRKELKECGAWDAEQLSDHDENILRMLWIMVCDIRETPDFYVNEDDEE